MTVSFDVAVPRKVRDAAYLAYGLASIGFKGGTTTGWERAEQLTVSEYIPLNDIREMRNWFARHIHTSYPTYKEWIDEGKPLSEDWHDKRGIIAWLIWGGTPAFEWVNSPNILRILNREYNEKYEKIPY